jgi:hypothetical protein
MARYTVELREIVKSGAKIFNFDYDFYDETKKADFEQKFVDHFYFREIGVETVGRFQHYLKCKCHEVLPFYNEMLKVCAMDYDLINNYNLTETFSKTNSSTKTSTENANQTGTSSNLNTNTSTLTRSADIDTTSKKTNTLDSTTKHNELNETETVAKETETGKLDKTSTLDIDGKKIESDTPNGLLAMADIKTNVYASNANIEDTTSKTIDAQTNSADKTNTTTDNATINVSDLNYFEEGTVVSPELLKELGIVKKQLDGIKVLGKGAIDKKLTVRAHKFSETAKKAIEAAGGKAEVI